MVYFGLLSLVTIGYFELQWFTFFGYYWLQWFTLGYFLWLLLVTFIDNIYVWCTIPLLHPYCERGYPLPYGDISKNATAVASVNFSRKITLFLSELLFKEKAYKK